MANIIFEFVDGSREIVWPGGPRHKELLAAGHVPVGEVPASDGISDTLQAYLSTALTQVATDTVVALLAKVSTTAVTDSYNLLLADAGKVVEANKATALTITIPPESMVAWPVGTVLEVFQLGLGQVTVAPGSGVTLLAPFGAKTAAQYATVSLRKRAADTWVLAGDTTT